jgi:UDP-glucose 4-epimerase
MMASAHVAALHQLNNGSETLTLNLGTGRAFSIVEIISTVERVTGRTVPVRMVRSSKYET